MSDLERNSEEIEMSPKITGGLKKVECNRCGDCCRSFTLTWSPERIKANLEAAYRGDSSYYYLNTDGVQASGSVNVMMAMWGNNLVPIEIPDEIRSQRVFELEYYGHNIYWYRCSNLQEEDGQYACSIHDHRPNTCSRYKPSFQGGYLSMKEQIVYKNCSYLRDWQELYLEKSKASLSDECIGQNNNVKGE